MEYQKFHLDNGLTVLYHQDTTTPMAVVNVLYNVGARDENPAQTGFAHLFEHLMFGGSINIPDYDGPLQRAGGENNAYTTNDITNYYCQLPAKNIETAFWLESDRMLSLAFSQKSLDTQKKVVCEEFKEHYINKPYGDAWQALRQLAYTTHPYQWMTIGKELSHIENAHLEDVKAFFNKHYCPSNAIIVIAGNIALETVKRLSEKWFSPIPSGKKYERNLPAEPKQLMARRKEITANVPLNALYKAWHMDARLEEGYYAADLITELLGGGGASRLYQNLIKEQRIFSNLDCYHFGSVEKGLLAIEGKLVQGVTLEQAEAALQQQIDSLTSNEVSTTELQKVINRTESIMTFEDISLLSRASSLAFAELLGNPNLMNTEIELYRKITKEDILKYSKRIFAEQNSNTLLYHTQ